MSPFYSEIGKRVLELNKDKLYSIREASEDGDLADLLIMRAASKLSKNRPDGVQRCI